MRAVLVWAVAVGASVAAGCGTPEAPLTAGGKPVAHWLDEMKKSDPKARKKAVKELGHVGTADPTAIPTVIAALKDKDPGVRKEAVLALLNLGPAGKSGEPALAEVAKSDPDKEVRRYAATALERVNGRGP